MSLHPKHATIPVAIATALLLGGALGVIGTIALPTSAGDRCEVAKRAAVPSLVAKGILTGEFEPTMSGICRGACAAKVDVPAARVAPQPGAGVGTFTQCPVSGVIFLVRTSSARDAFAERTIYTCCGSCLRRLKADPERFLRI
jgi:hypothetical protein